MLDEWVNQLIIFLQSSYAYAVVAWALRPAWYDPIGRTIILTAFGYFVAFSLFTGYFTRFAKGIGGISPQQVGFHWSDIITLFPAGIATILNFVESARSRIIWASLYGGAILLVHLGGAIIASAMPHLFGGFSVSWQTFLLQLAPILYFFSMVGLFSVLFWRSGEIRLIIGSYIAVCLSVAFYGILVSSVSVVIPPEPTWIKLLGDFFIGVFRDISVILYGLILLLLPFVFGVKIAEQTVKQGMLSQVTHLTLQQPLACLKKYEEPQLAIHSEPSVPWTQRWFTKPSFHVSVRPDVYSYRSTPGKPLYLIASFRENLAVFEPGDGGELIDGRLILINQNLVRAIELRSSKNPEEA